MTKNTLNEYKNNLMDDGVVHLHGLLDEFDLLELNAAIDENMNKPSPFGTQLQNDDSGGKFFTDFNNWKRLPKIENFCRKGNILEAIKSLTGSKTGRLFHDHVLVKEGSSIATPWHQDRPYYIFKGDLNLSIWMPTGDVAEDSSLIFWRGSHKFNNLYMPKGFADGRALGDDDRFLDLKVDDIPSSDIMSFDMKAGDAIVFLNNTVHGSRPHSGPEARRALSIRMLLDGASMTSDYVNATPPFDRMGVKVVEGGEIPERFPVLW
jgi:ectoine hydroxylase-related dioxygenase (phytanoyl-CoA dioxygenase family)